MQSSIESFCSEHEEVKHATFHMVDLAINRDIAPFVKTTYPLEWIRFYLLNNLVVNDPVVRHSRTIDQPFHWSEIVLKINEMSTMEHAVSHGISTNGYSVPTAITGPYRGLFSICPDLSLPANRWSDFTTQNETTITSTAFYLHQIALSDIDPFDNYVNSLSPREIECLHYISDGKTYTEIAKIAGLSEHTIRSYIRALRKKLNCSTLAQAVAKACAQGII